MFTGRDLITKHGEFTCVEKRFTNGDGRIDSSHGCCSTNQVVWYDWRYVAVFVYSADSHQNCFETNDLRHGRWVPMQVYWASHSTHIPKSGVQNFYSLALKLNHKSDSVSKAQFRTIPQCLTLVSLIKFKTARNLQWQQREASDAVRFTWVSFVHKSQYKVSKMVVHI